MINFLETEGAAEGNFWIPGSESALVEPPTKLGEPRLSFCHIGIGHQVYILMLLTKHSQIKLKNPGGAPLFELCTSIIFDWNFSVFCRIDCWMQAVSEQFIIALTTLNLVEIEGGAVHGNTVPLKINPAMIVTIRHHHHYHHCPTKIEMHNLIIIRPISESLRNMCFESGAPPVEQTLRIIDLSHHSHLEGFRKRFVLPHLTFLIPSLYVSPGLRHERGRKMHILILVRLICDSVTSNHLQIKDMFSCGFPHWSRAQ